MAAKKKSSNKKPKKVQTPQQIAARLGKAHSRGIEQFFRSVGFTKIPSDGKEIQFKGRSGEIDGMFVHKNIVIVAEYTATKSSSEHLLKKKVLFDLILENQAEFIDSCRDWYDGFSDSLPGVYSSTQCKVCVVYAAINPPNDEVQSSCSDYRFMHGSCLKYFQLLAKTISLSARVELLKFLGVKYEEYGDNILTASALSAKYSGLLLPEENSSYPKGFKVVSFYADAESLIRKSYVLRRDSWRDESDHLYQRILVPKKIKAMRKYLSEEHRVFVNNVIATLPEGTELAEHSSSGGKKSPAASVKPTRVDVSIPDEHDVIGIIDGQHRIFCYHEGVDVAEPAVALLRKKQNLMVTGIIYPENTPERERRRFEAKLFLEINDNQARTKSSLKQDIEVIIRPYSAVAISKRVMYGLAKKGPLSGKLQTGYFDGADIIKTSSIVSYGLRPLVKLDGEDSLYFAWNEKNKENLKVEGYPERDDLLEAYIRFCTDSINNVFTALRIALSDEKKWVHRSKDGFGILSPTVVNGIIVFIRESIQNNKSLSRADLQVRFAYASAFDFSAYKSSQWKALGEKLYEEAYS